MDTFQPQIEEKPSLWQRFKRFLIQCKRVFKVTRKPSKEEFLVISKVTGIGILIIGLLGFIIKFAWELIR
ncbi:protein translocase SEC61 complex subunit gamma [Candidatus Woesearchaeota archaeon]|nr:protein translocase SEC61 complex subunit gamma [Candidatus Woesearchaeota archaeon]